MRSLILLCLILCIASSFAEKKKIVCYYGTWAVWRSGSGKFEVTNIDPKICTHIIYTFFGATADGQITYLDPYLDLPDGYGKDFIGKFMKLKSINPEVKLLAAVGGWNQGSVVFSQLASSESTRKAFANNAANFLIKHGFDGLDLDWEYPNQRNGVQADKENFISLLAELKKTLTALQKSLSIAVGSTEKSASASYHIARVADNVDFINLMSYDLHGSWNNFTGIHGALYPHSRDSTDELLRELNVDAAVGYWLNQGCPREKLIVGIPTYGRTFTLGNANENGIGAYATGPGSVGSFVPEAGFLGFNELCYKQSEWTRYWEQQQQVPYAVKGNQWVGYDDIESVTMKLNYILERDLGGVMYWSLETDDFANLCGHGKFPLITLASTLFNSELASSTLAPPSISTSSQSTPTVKTPPTATSRTIAPTATTKTQTSTINPGESFACPSAGLHRDPKDCTKFFNCSNGTPYHFECPASLYFNELVGVCDWPRNVVCSWS